MGGVPNEFIGLLQKGSERCADIRQLGREFAALIGKTKKRPQVGTVGGSWEVTDGCCLCGVQSESVGVQHVTTVIHFRACKNELLQAKGDAVVASTLKGLSDVCKVIGEGHTMNKAIVDYLDKVPQV